MDSITLENFRCFREKQNAALAPLTLLVGENSTGKTSFLAIIRILSDMAFSFRNPDFKEDPYDLGSFDEIAHYRGAGGSKADQFEAGFSANARGLDGFHVTFGKSGSTPVPVRRRLHFGKDWIDETDATDRPYSLKVGTSRGAWEVRGSAEHEVRPTVDLDMIVPRYYFTIAQLGADRSEMTDILPLDGAPPFDSEDRVRLSRLAHGHFHTPDRPFASAPVRSKPRRTYDPARPTPDPEGDYVPMYLADVYSRDKQTWKALNNLLEDYGKASGLFDEISIKRLGNREGEPFQVQVRKSGGKRLKGPWRNLIDVGYGVSQALPVITELLRENAPDTFLLQQPEVHLHPMAQAALGSLFCQVVGPERQLIVETHSDHLLDRVRMEIRDGTELRPDDVSILFFERGDLDVRIHSLRIDEMGNILDTPDSYRRFFMQETQRSLGL